MKNVVYVLNQIIGTKTIYLFECGDNPDLKMSSIFAKSNPLKSSPAYHAMLHRSRDFYPSLKHKPLFIVYHIELGLVRYSNRVNQIHPTLIESKPSGSNL